MQENINIKLKISKKTTLVLTSLVGMAAMAEYVSSVDAKTGDNGVIVNEEKIIDATPVGTIVMWGTSAVPSGWIELDGGSTAGYPGLASLYGSTVPDFRGQHVRAWDHGKGIDSGRGLLSVQADNVKSHGHDLSYGGYGLTQAKQTVDGTGPNAVYSYYRYGRGSTYSRPEESDTLKALSQHNGVAMIPENRVKNISVMFIVKAEITAD